MPSPLNRLFALREAEKRVRYFLSLYNEGLLAMQTYTVKLDRPKPRLKFRLAWLLLYGATFFVLDFSWTLLSRNSSEQSRGPSGIAIEVGIVALVWGTLMAFRPLLSRPTYTLLVYDDSITGISKFSGWMSWLSLRKTVRRGMVRTIFEIKGRFGTPGGVGISERSLLGARMLGFVFLPRTLETYDELKRLAESWSQPDGQ